MSVSDDSSMETGSSQDEPIFSSFLDIDSDADDVLSLSVLPDDEGGDPNLGLNHIPIHPHDTGPSITLRPQQPRVPFSEMSLPPQHNITRSLPLKPKPEGKENQAHPSHKRSVVYDEDSPIRSQKKARLSYERKQVLLELGSEFTQLIQRKLSISSDHE